MDSVKRIFVEKKAPFAVKAKELKTEIENLAKGGPIAYADYFLFNNGSLEDYEKRLLEILDDIEIKDLFFGCIFAGVIFLFSFLKVLSFIVLTSLGITRLVSNSPLRYKLCPWYNGLA